MKESIDDEDIPEISEGIAYVSVSAAGGGDSDSDSDIPDMEDFEEERNLEEEDAVCKHTQFHPTISLECFGC